MAKRFGTHIRGKQPGDIGGQRVVQTVPLEGGSLTEGEEVVSR
jgi:hypothetical protein